MLPASLWHTPPCRSFSPVNVRALSSRVTLSVQKKTRLKSLGCACTGWGVAKVALVLDYPGWPCLRLRSWGFLSGTRLAPSVAPFCSSACAVLSPQTSAHEMHAVLCGRSDRAEGRVFLSVREVALVRLEETRHVEERRRKKRLSSSVGGTRFRFV